MWPGSTPEPWLKGVPDPYDGAGGDPYHRWGSDLSMASASATLRPLPQGQPGRDQDHEDRELAPDPHRRGGRDQGSGGGHRDPAPAGLRAADDLRRVHHDHDRPRSRRAGRRGQQPPPRRLGSVTGRGRAGPAGRQPHLRRRWPDCTARCSRASRVSGWRSRSRTARGGRPSRPRSTESTGAYDTALPGRGTYRVVYRGIDGPAIRVS